MLNLHFPREREDLAWYFGGGKDGKPGLKAAGLEFGGGVFDDAAQDRLHAAMLRRRGDSRRVAKVGAVLTQVGHHRGRLESAFSPFGAGRASWRLLDTLAKEGVRLIGCIVDSSALLRVMRADVDVVPVDVQLAWLEDEVLPLRGNRIPGNHKLHKLVEGAAADVAEALSVYAKARPCVDAAFRAQRVAEASGLAVKNAPWLQQIDEAGLLQ